MDKYKSVIFGYVKFEVPTEALIGIEHGIQKSSHLHIDDIKVMRLGAVT